MDLLAVALASLFAAVLTLFSGFGLGTLLTPIFALFFPLEVAVGATAVVHLCNNIFKLALLGRFAAWPAVWRFGLPAIPAAFLGAMLLTSLAGGEPLTSYEFFGRIREPTVLGLALGSVIGLFALIDLFGFLADKSFGKSWLPLGGALSGFFGGLSGHQGALRSAFLLRWGLSKEAFIATNVVCATAVDVVRLSVYGRGSPGEWLTDPEAAKLLATAILAAFLGSFIGSRLLKKVTLEFVHRLVGAMLLLIAVAIAAGLV